jgi:hypothetical protein
VGSDRCSFGAVFVPWFAAGSGACSRLAAVVLLLSNPPDKGALGDFEPGGGADEADALTAHFHESVPGAHVVNILSCSMI